MKWQFCCVRNDEGRGCGKAMVQGAELDYPKIKNMVYFSILYKLITENFGFVSKKCKVLREEVMKK